MRNPKRDPNALCQCGDVFSDHVITTAMPRSSLGYRDGCQCYSCVSDRTPQPTSRCVVGCACATFRACRLGWKIEVTEHPRSCRRFWAVLVSHGRREMVGKYLDSSAARRAALKLALNMSRLNKVNRGKYDENEDY